MHKETASDAAKRHAHRRRQDDARAMGRGAYRRGTPPGDTTSTRPPQRTHPRTRCVLRTGPHGASGGRHRRRAAHAVHHRPPQRPSTPSRGTPTAMMGYTPRHVNAQCHAGSAGPRDGWASAPAAPHRDPLRPRSGRRGATRPAAVAAAGATTPTLVAPQNAPSSTWGVQRVVVTLATATPGVPPPAAARAPDAAIEQRRVAATARGDRAPPAAAATADNAAPPAAATVTVRVAVASDGARWREGSSRATKLGAAAGRRPRTHWPPRPPPRRGLADAQRRPRARPADGSAPVRG